MLEATQFRNKVKTHGLFRTLRYSAEFVTRPMLRKLWVEPFLKSYSQRYEDLIIDRLLGDRKTGTYLDIGAYDPHRLSNTRRFHDRGWRGCNVEPNPRRFQKFVRARPGDINLNAGVSDAPGTLVLFDVERDSFSTLSVERARQLERMGARIKREIEVPVMRMEQLFEEHFEAQSVDFCSVDTEGMDLAVLKGNDWSRFRPLVLCIEAQGTGIGPVENGPHSVERLMLSVGYRKYTQTYDFGVPLNEIYVSEALKAD